MPNEEKFTILIPTLNRANFLNRLLHYYAANGYRHWIFIGDSSDSRNFNATKEIIASLEGKLKVRQFECPGMSDVGAIEYMNQFVTTPYCAFLADDDFLCVESIDKCIAFLEQNGDYGAAHGMGINTSVAHGPYGNIKNVNYYRQATLTGGSGSQRLLDYYSEGPYALIFSVHRTESWREMHRGLMDVPWARQGFIFGELIISSVSSIRNKIKELDCLYLVRFGHDKIYRQVERYNWLTDPDWYSGFKDLHDRSINDLMRQDGIDEDKAEEVFRQAFAPFLSRIIGGLAPSAGRSSADKTIARIRKLAGKLPGLRLAYSKIVARGKKDGVNLLPSLLDPASPYHEDFMPVYRSITLPPAEGTND